MYAVRLNDVSIQVKGQSVFIQDVFGDMQEAEAHRIICYLLSEGFIDAEKELNVFIKTKPLLAKGKKEGKKAH